MTEIACVVIAGGRRRKLLDQVVIPSVLAQPFDEVLVVGMHHDGPGYRYLHIPDLTKSTTDALIKRDAGTLASSASLLLYLCDDHAVVNGVEEARAMATGPLIWDVMVPQRIAEHPEKGLIRINNGETGGYCGGHGGLYRRRVVQNRPWSAQPHHREWDLLASQNHQKAGFIYITNGPLVIRDMETEAQPWL